MTKKYPQNIMVLWMFLFFYQELLWKIKNIKSAVQAALLMFGIDQSQQDEMVASFGGVMVETFAEKV